MGFESIRWFCCWAEALLSGVFLRGAPHWSLVPCSELEGADPRHQRRCNQSTMNHETSWHPTSKEIQETLKQFFPQFQWSWLGILSEKASQTLDLPLTCWIICLWGQLFINMLTKCALECLQVSFPQLFVSFFGKFGLTFSRLFVTIVTLCICFSFIVLFLLVAFRSTTDSLYLCLAKKVIFWAKRPLFTMFFLIFEASLGLLELYFLGFANFWWFFMFGLFAFWPSGDFSRVLFGKSKMFFFFFF